jgi:hypothetical protein
MSPRRSQPKRGGKSVFAVPGDPADPDGFYVVAQDWLEWLATHNYSHMTLVDHSYWLARFAAWAELRGVSRPAEVTLPVLEAYQRHVSFAQKARPNATFVVDPGESTGGAAGVLRLVQKDQAPSFQPGRRAGDAPPIAQAPRRHLDP